MQVIIIVGRAGPLGIELGCRPNTQEGVFCEQIGREYQCWLRSSGRMVETRYENGGAHIL